MPAAEPRRSSRVRAFTVGVDAVGIDPGTLAEDLRRVFETGTATFERAGFEVHTRRLTLPPARPGEGQGRFAVANQLGTVTRAAEAAGVRWLCQPLVAETEAHATDARLAAVEIVRRFQSVFVDFIIAESGKIYCEALPQVAQAVLDIAHLSRNGFDNFRVGAGCNLGANTPFFPFSYHAGNAGFSVALEILETVLRTLEALPDDAGLEDRRSALVAALEADVRAVDEVGRAIEAETGFEYKGVDISLAPFPDARRSLAVLFARMGLAQIGDAGTVAVTSFFSNLLKAVMRKTAARAVGFNGVMFSLMEDVGLAASSNRRNVSIDKLLGWSTVCGCGIDMVPVAGSIMREELAALMLDTAALSTVLQKPLGVRVLPIPEVEVNEMTNFNHDFLVNTRVLPLSAQGQSLPLPGAAGGVLTYLPR